MCISGLIRCRTLFGLRRPLALRSWLLRRVAWSFWAVLRFECGGTRMTLDDFTWAIDAIWVSHLRNPESIRHLLLADERKAALWVVDHMRFSLPQFVDRVSAAEFVARSGWAVRYVNADFVFAAAHSLGGNVRSGASYHGAFMRLSKPAATLFSVLLVVVAFCSSVVAAPPSGYQVTLTVTDDSGNPPSAFTWSDDLSALTGIAGSKGWAASHTDAEFADNALIVDPLDYPGHWTEFVNAFEVNDMGAFSVYTPSTLATAFADNITIDSGTGDGVGSGSFRVAAVPEASSLLLILPVCILLMSPLFFRSRRMRSLPISSSCSRSSVRSGSLSGVFTASF